MFHTNYHKLITEIQAFDDNEYARSRNFIEGNVSRFSLYLTHGFLSLPTLRELAEQKENNERFIYELGWREYFQKVFALLGDEIFSDLQTYKTGLSDEDYDQSGIPADILEARTGILALDDALQGLYENGYMHNHARMWFASYLIHYRRIHWKIGAAFFFYHLLDGDLASNTLGWQWVASTFSSKPYIFNQANLNTFGKKSTQQKGTFFDRSYDELQVLLFKKNHKIKVSDFPIINKKTISLEEALPFKHFTDFKDIRKTISSQYENLIWLHPYMLDANAHWARDPNYLKVLIFDPANIQQHPISEKRLNFILQILENNFSDYIIVQGEVIASIKALADEFQCKNILSRSYFSNWYKQNKIALQNIFNFEEENYPFAFPEKTLTKIFSFSRWWRENKKDTN